MEWDAPAIEKEAHERWGRRRTVSLIRHAGTAECCANTTPSSLQAKCDL